jgi:hypothetical protein
MKWAAHNRAALIGRPDSAKPCVRSALLSEVVSANVAQVSTVKIKDCSNDAGLSVPPASLQLTVQITAKGGSYVGANGFQTNPNLLI